MTDPGSEHRPGGEQDDGTTRRLPTVDPGAPLGFESQPPPVVPAPVGRARRFWSARRVPSAITALLALAVSGSVLYDVTAVRAGRQGMTWRGRLAEELATRPLRDHWVITGAAIAALLGLWLIVLALTPGLRSLLPMRPAAAEVRAALDRRAAGLLVRDRVLQVSGVRSVRVSVSPRSIKVRADAHFRDLDDVRQDVAATLREAVRSLGLDRRPVLSLTVRRAGRG
ncbi:DUF6286 domain-containing protein [Streptantibioticus ferralitis]|uniref:DUF6286 domain-containing protein n=1 Tax=Streptantibioticus ferralitis TaxID=236510 RepID=A0ABT5YZ88_9ACTN|nr:DUF6286 domain-containing protein [Streptantibioticus ferralitis]MDF2256885.1 DUF6286 domain-containing protein [Streptantibioticus ferralitis]